MPQTAIDFFTSKRLSLMGVLTTPEGQPGRAPAFVACHPHPMLGGNMDHPLITAMCRSAGQQGIASLRFNFRGVGDSQGSFSNGPEEQHDLRAALDILKLLPGADRKRLALVGYSFGASVILDGLRRFKSAASLVLIAPPISSLRKSSIVNDKRPKLFMVGQQDRVVPSGDLQRLLDEVRPPVQFTEIPGTDHSLRAHEQEVSDRALAFLLETLGG